MPFFRSAVRNNFRRVKIKFAGGESTLNYKVVIDLHKYALKLAEGHGIELTGIILSNGVSWSHAMIQVVKDTGMQVMLSIDGIGSAHDVQRPFINGKGSFAHVERTLSRFASCNVVPTISITVTQRNITGIARLVTYLLDRHLPFSINFYRENDCSSSTNDLQYQEDHLISHLKEAFLEIEANLPRYSLLGTLVDRASLVGAHSKPCGVGNTYMVINESGGVTDCQMRLDNLITTIEVTDPLQQIRDNKSAVRNLPVDEKEGCKTCSWRYMCAGGCPILTYRTTGRYDVKSPNCHIYKSLFPAVIRLEAFRLLQYSSISA